VADYGMLYLLIVVGFWFGEAVRGGINPFPSSREDALLVILAPVAWMLFMGTEHLYERRVLLSAVPQAKKLTKVSLLGIAFLIFVIYAFKIRSGVVHREIAFAVALSVWIGLLCYRILIVGQILANVQKSYAEGRRMVIVGSDEKAAKVASRLNALSRFRPEVIGFIDDHVSLARSSINGGRILGDFKVLPFLCNSGSVDEVLITKSDMSPERLVELSESCATCGVGVKIVSSVLNVFLGRASVDEIDGMPIVEVHQSRLRGGWRMAKRAFDLFGALAIITLLSPVLLVLAIGVKMSSPGSVLYRQERIGKRGRRFTFYKFRTMVDGHEDAAHRDYVTEFVRGGGEATVDSNGRKVYKVTDDERVTSFGRFLRKTSLDELPQLINVVKGEMSLVGPRPCLPYEWELYKSWQKKRLAVTPGMTGLWQVTGRSSVSFDDMVLLDLHYITNWSFTWDVSLILQTVPVVAFARGAH
jgi:undecaprenyl-phosphate galactose phosphotransferase